MIWLAIREKAHNILGRVNDRLERDQERDRLTSLFSWLGHYSVYFLTAAAPIGIASAAAGRSVAWLLWLATSGSSSRGGIRATSVGIILAIPGGVYVGQEGLEFLIGFEDAGLRHVIDRFDRPDALAPHLLRD